MYVNTYKSMFFMSFYWSSPTKNSNCDPEIYLRTNLKNQLCVCLTLTYKGPPTRFYENWVALKILLH